MNPNRAHQLGVRPEDISIVARGGSTTWDVLWEGRRVITHGSIFYVCKWRADLERLAGINA